MQFNIGDRVKINSPSNIHPSYWMNGATNKKILWCHGMAGEVINSSYARAKSFWPNHNFVLLDANAGDPDAFIIGDSNGDFFVLETTQSPPANMLTNIFKTYYGNPDKSFSKSVPVEKCECGAFKVYGAPKGSPLHTMPGRGLLGCSWAPKDNLKNG